VTDGIPYPHVHERIAAFADDRFAHEPATLETALMVGFFIACVAAFAVCRWRDAGRYGPPATRWERLANLKAAPMGLASWATLVIAVLAAVLTAGPTVLSQRT